MSDTPVSRNEWIAYGLSRGWVVRPYCLTHDHSDEYADPKTGAQIAPCEHVLPLVVDAP